MKYSPLSFKKDNVFKIYPPLKGINNYDSTGESDPLEAVRLNNVIIENGCIKNRKGLNAEYKNLLDLEGFYNSLNVDVSLTDCEFSVDGVTGKIAVAYVKKDDSSNIYRVFLVGSDSTIKRLGDMFFNRSSEFVFYVPTSITFFKAKPQSGGGLYAFVRLHNMYGTASTQNRIYEIDAEYKNWNQYNTSYTPTVYINGRGNAYDVAKDNGTVYTGQPKFLETLNLLEGTFKAYYSSDGYSSLFTLPYTDLANGTVSCKLYTDASNYIKWVVYEGQTSSLEVTCNGKAVKMYVDRINGFVYFKSGTANMPLPVMGLCQQNNICFTATKDTGYSFDDIVSCEIAVPSGNKVFFANGKRQNEIFVCDKDNPFYFPQCFNNSVGDDGAKVTAMCSTGEELFAFKETGVYSVKLRGEKTLNKALLLADDTSYFKDLGDFDITRISNNYGCENLHSLKILGKTPIWFSKGGEVSVIKNHTVKPVTQKIDKKVLEIFKDNGTVATVSLNSYILMNKNKAFVISVEDDLSVSYFWDFPEKLTFIGGVSDGEKNAFFVKTDSTFLFYTAFLSGEKDIVLTAKDESEEFPVIKTIGTKKFLESNSKKIIKRVVLDCDFNKELKFLVDGNSVKEKFLLSRNDLSKEKDTDVVVGRLSTKSVALNFETKGDIVFKGAEIFYS